MKQAWGYFWFMVAILLLGVLGAVFGMHYMDVNKVSNWYIVCVIPYLIILASIAWWLGQKAIAKERKVKEKEGKR